MQGNTEFDEVNGRAGCRCQQSNVAKQATEFIRARIGWRQRFFSAGVCDE
jgi:hypothetical protein